jgi:hypothetical protein
VTDPQPPVPPQPGDRQPRLDRAPGERYRRPAGDPGAPDGGGGSGPGSRSGSASAPRAILAAILVADACALLYLVLAQVDLGVGMLAVAGFAGWATGIALLWWGREALPARTTRVGVAALVAGSAIVLALALDWAWSLAQGGALGPIAYATERFGVVAPLSIAVAAGVAALRAR